MSEPELRAPNSTGSVVEEPSEVTAENITDVDEREEVVPARYTLTSYGADFLVDGLVTRLRSGDVLVPSFDPEIASESSVEGFQRNFVWSKSQADRFLESLLLGLPVPGIFLVSEVSGVLLVLDGQQRLRTLLAFYDGILRGKEFKLQYVQEQFRGLTYRTLDDEDRRRLDNSIIHATIVRQDEPVEGQAAIYQIFERLNTGGTLLQPQEIRVALFRGDLLRLLRELNNDANWRALVGPASPRLKDQELILRFLALLEDGHRYSRPMVAFLNRYMDANRDPSSARIEELRSLFTGAVSAIRVHVGDRAFRPTASVNAAVLDSLMVGVARRLRGGSVHNGDALNAAYTDLLKDPEYLDATSRATADDESVRTRLQLATEVFAKVG